MKTPQFTIDDLNEHISLLADLEQARGDLKAMEESTLRASQFDDLPGGSGVGRRVENLALTIQRQREDVERLEKVVSRSENSIRAFVETIDDPHTRTVFDLRYLCGMKWEDVAAYLGITYDSVRKTCYRYLKFAA